MNYIYKVVPKTLTRTTYDAKEQLKDCGCRYDSVLGWYSKDKVSIPSDFTLIPLEYDKIYNKDHIIVSGGAEYIASTLSAINTIEINSEWFGEVWTRYYNIKCVVLNKKAMSTRYGLKYQYIFKYNNHILEWTTGVDYKVTPNSIVTLAGTVKGHINNYGAKVTQLNRCTLEIIEIAAETKKKEGFEWG